MKWTGKGQIQTFEQYSQEKISYILLTIITDVYRKCFFHYSELISEKNILFITQINIEFKTDTQSMFLSYTQSECLNFEFPVYYMESLQFADFEGDENPRIAKPRISSTQAFGYRCL